MLNVRKTLGKVLSQMPRVGTNYVTIGNLGICWGHQASAQYMTAISMPITYSSIDSYAVIMQPDEKYTGDLPRVYVQYQQRTTSSFMPRYTDHVGGWKAEWKTGLYWIAIGNITGGGEH